MAELPFGEPAFSTPFTNQSGPAILNELLQEDGFRILQEDGSKILLD